MSRRDATAPVRIYLCECGPIIRDVLDLDALAGRLSEMVPGGQIAKHSTLCSVDGQKWMEDDLHQHPGHHVVVAGCSPREHEDTFRRVCRAAGVNPFLLAMANIREQCTWVTRDGDQAADKALALVLAAVSRARRQEALQEVEIDCTTDVLVVGAGVAGLSAASMLAQADRKVILVERSGAVGGRTPLLGDVFPSMECASCMIEPLMDEVLHHPSVEVLTLSELTEVLGYSGNFTVRITKHARHVDADGCYGCATCHAACPVQVPRQADEGLSTRAAIYIPYEGALPGVSLVDPDACLGLGGGDCDACVGACPFGNIDLSTSDEMLERSVGAIVLATGATPVEASLERPSRVLTAMAVERLLNPSGPTGGEFRLPDADPIRSVALIHCMDENLEAPSLTCSKTCCMAFAKYVQQIGEKVPGVAIHEIGWERCTGGKGYREFSRRAEAVDGVSRIRLAPGDVVHAPRQSDDTVTVSYTLDGAPAELEVDLAVVAPPLVGDATSADLARILRIDLDGEGFFVEENEHLAIYKTRLPGVLVAGGARGPADIQEASAQGAAAAGSVLATLVPGRKLRVEPATARVDEAMCGGCRTCILTCPYRAVTWDEERGAARVDEMICRGCGSCAAACPAGAIDAKHFTDHQIGAELTTLLEARCHPGDSSGDE